MLKRISAIEIGTNSTKFITVSLNPNKTFQVIEKTSTVNRLSKSMYGKNLLSDEAIETGIKIIGEFIERSKELEAELVAIFSTSVLRDAENKMVFISKVKEKYGVDIQVISGDKEATLAYNSCSSLASKDEENIAVIDIGGGSTEFSIGDREKIRQKFSFDIGAVRLTEMFVKHDPISTDEIFYIKNYIDHDILKDINKEELKNYRLIGTGGTVKTIGTIFLQRYYKDEPAVNNLQLSLNQIKEISVRLSSIELEKRRVLIGLNPKRADVINTGLVILISVMESFSIDSITISAQGVIEGYINEYQMSFDK